MSLHHSPKIVTNGLVLCLDAGNRKSYSGSGTVWRDLSGNNNNGILLNSPVFSNDKNGCFVLNNVSPGSNINCTGFTFNNPNLTFSCWFKVNTVGNGYKHFISKELSCKYRIGNTSGVVELLCSTSGVGWTDVIITPNIILSNTWYNIVTTVQSNGPLVIYVNGIIVASGVISGILATNSNAINIGSWDPAGYDPFDGSIAIAKVYNRILSNIEVLQEYTALKGRFNL